MQQQQQRVSRTRASMIGSGARCVPAGDALLRQGVDHLLSELVHRLHVGGLERELALLVALCQPSNAISFLPPPMHSVFSVTCNAPFR